MHKLLSRLLKPILGILALLATGCSGGPQVVSLYMPAPPPPDPTVKIVDFTYTPSPQAHTGEALRFTVTLNKAKPDDGFYNPFVMIGSALVPIIGGAKIHTQVDLNDRGAYPDQVAGDAIWTGEYTIPATWQLQDELPVVSFCGDSRRGALDLEIVEEE